MADPNEICLEVGAETKDPRDRINTYKIIHLTNIIRKNVRRIALDVDSAKFCSFLLRASSRSDAMLIATRDLPKTITKSVVSSLGGYQVEGRNNVGFSTTFNKLFADNVDKEAAADFFLKNLTTACCHEGLVFLLLPSLALRYDLKSREKWFNRLRFVWNSCALLRLPCLLPVIACQFFLYTIRMFINQPSLTRSEELNILVELLHFLPGVLKVAQPMNGVGLSAWYRNLARHRRIVLEELLNDARNNQDIRLFNPPFSMMEFESIDKVIDYIEEEMKVCDRQVTMEEEMGRRRRTTEKEYFGEDSDMDEEDRELLLLGGYTVESEEVVIEEEMEVDIEDMEEAIENEKEESEKFEEEYSENYQFIHNEEKKVEKGTISSRKKRAERDHSITRCSLPMDLGIYKHLVKKLPDYPSETCEDGKNINDEKNSGEKLSMKKEEETVWEDQKNEAAFEEFFKIVPEMNGWREGEDTEWDSSIILSHQAIEQGFEEAKNLMVRDSKTMGSSMNLSIPMIPGIKKTDDHSMSSDELPSPTVSEEREGSDGGDILPPIRSDEDSGKEERDGERERPLICSGDCLPAPHIPVAPRKEMRKEDEMEDGNDMGMMDTVNIEDDEIVFIEEILGNNGATGLLRVVKREDGIINDEMEEEVIMLQ
ncbi:hypothetical protein PENTCL1PPCAC_6412 [Pristionchus entomophagus]|uniref:Uncharacterized protein n=1 Tax=Pristionchus entomophagus TaxID=358040 RepID=A0AAV5SLK5_9BILA|nr:hypothetical protein PENTCL1PPCAC_6412 [Pristionchus entomophagus]